MSNRRTIYFEKKIEKNFYKNKIIDTQIIKNYLDHMRN